MVSQAWKCKYCDHRITVGLYVDNASRFIGDLMKHYYECHEKASESLRSDIHNAMVKYMEPGDM